MQASNHPKRLWSKARVVSVVGKGAREGNGCIERFFKTLKEQLLWVRHFQSIPELVAALEDFRALYNQPWLIERLGFLSPIQARERLPLEPAAWLWCVLSVQETRGATMFVGSART